MKIIPYRPQYAEQIRQIYAPYVRKGYVSFETKLPDIKTFNNRIAHYTQRHPWLLALEGDTVLGYAYAAAYRERAAYQWVVESSVYVAAGHKKAGIATKLYQALFDLLKVEGIYKVFAVITIPNPESVGFHEKLGFQWFATYKNVGYKSSKWCDVGWWELVLTEPTGAIAQPPVAYPDLDPALVAELLAPYAG